MPRRVKRIRLDHPVEPEVFERMLHWYCGNSCAFVWGRVPDKLGRDFMRDFVTQVALVHPESPFRLVVKGVMRGSLLKFGLGPVGDDVLPGVHNRRWRRRVARGLWLSPRTATIDCHRLYRESVNAWQNEPTMARRNWWWKMLRRSRRRKAEMVTWSASVVTTESERHDATGQTPTPTGAPARA